MISFTVTVVTEEILLYNCSYVLLYRREAHYQPQMRLLLMHAKLAYLDNLEQFQYP